MLGCPDCERTTAANCGKYHFVPYTTLIFPPTYPVCIKCGRSSLGMTKIPYPSNHDDELICNDCLAKIIDAIVPVQA